MPSSNGPLNSTRKKLANKPRERGTSPPQRAVTEFEEGQKVHLKIDPSVPNGRFHARFSGLTGEVTGKQGRSYKVAINDNGKDKVVLAYPAHLRAQN